MAHGQLLSDTDVIKQQDSTIFKSMLCPVSIGWRVHHTNSRSSPTVQVRVEDHAHDAGKKASRVQCSLIM